MHTPRAGTSNASGYFMSALVVFYSRTGTTRKVAQNIARGLGADFEEIREATDRRGVLGYIRSAFEAIYDRWVPIDSLTRDATQYDLVVVGTPVWNASLCAPARAFLAANAHRLPKVAFFVTEGGRGARRVFGQMAEVVGAQPIATAAFMQRDVDHGRDAEAIASFVGSLRQKTAQMPAVGSDGHDAGVAQSQG